MNFVIILNNKLRFRKSVVLQKQVFKIWFSKQICALNPMIWSEKLLLNFMNFSGNFAGFSEKFYFGNYLLKIFFEQMDVSVSAKNPKMTEYLKWKITWEIEKFNFFKNLHVDDFVFGSDHHLVVHRRYSHKKIRSILHFYNKCHKCFKTHRVQYRHKTTH